MNPKQPFWTGKSLKVLILTLGSRLTDSTLSKKNSSNLSSGKLQFAKLQRVKRKRTCRKEEGGERTSRQEVKPKATQQREYQVGGREGGRKMFVVPGVYFLQKDNVEGRGRGRERTSLCLLLTACKRRRRGSKLDL